MQEAGPSKRSSSEICGMRWKSFVPCLSRIRLLLHYFLARPLAFQ